MQLPQLSNEFYIYMYLDPDNVPFYVGKGSEDRYKVRCHLGKNSPNPFLKRKISKVGVPDVKIHFLHKNITEDQAFYLEEYYIAGYGRRDLGLGPLCNLTNGGEGVSGYVWSNEAREKKSKAMKGKNNPNYGMVGEKNPNYGISLSNATKQKLSAANKGKKMSTEAKRKIAKAATGRKMSNEAKQKISKVLKGQIPWNKGISISDEHKQKIGKAHKGMKRSEKTKQKMSMSQKGRKVSDEGKQRMREAWKRRKAHGK